MGNDLDVTFGVPGSSEVVFGNKYDTNKSDYVYIIQ